MKKVDTDMRVHIGEKELKNPVIAASGTFGFGTEYMEYFDVSLLGGIALKAVTAEPRTGNPSPRIAETASGIINSVGLQNPGVDIFISDVLPKVEKIDTLKIANVAGSTVESYVEVIEKLNDTCVDIFELNVSCPNVKEGGLGFGADEAALFSIVSKAKLAAKKPLIVKLTPNVTSVAQMAKISQDAGADAVSLVNTFTAMAIDARKRRPILANVTGGLSGPAIKPIALRMVRDVYSVVSIPIVGMGGIMTGQDAAEFMLAGADAVMVGTATLAEPEACRRILSELEEFAQEEGIEKIAELTGALIV